MKSVYDKIIEFLKDELEVDSSGHSLDHAVRVYRLAQNILESEGGDERVTLISALVHDVIDAKLFDDVFSQKAKLFLFLQSIGCSQVELEKIFYIIENISYKGGAGTPVQSLEARIVQDADRLDAIGAIGVGRTFMYGGSRGSKMYDEEILPVNFENEADYRSNKGTILNHFDEKLFKLKDLMNTDRAKVIANERHEFMKLFVEQFLHEWHMEK
ncbi:MAG: HD domain-containing protein [Turicibacter sp.]